MSRCSGKHFYIRSPNRIIQNTAHAQSVDYLRVGRSTFCPVILITRIPWVHIRVHHATRSHRGQVPECTSDCPEPQTFNTFSHKKHITIPMTTEEIRDWHGLKDLALSWWIGARFFDAGEICELRLHTVTCLASLYVGKQHRRRSNKPQNRIKRPGIEPRLHRKSNNRPKFT